MSDTLKIDELKEIIARDWLESKFDDNYKAQINRLERENEVLRKEIEKLKRGKRSWQQKNNRLQRAKDELKRKREDPSSGASSSRSVAPPVKKRIRRFSEIQLFHLETELDQKRLFTKDVLFDLVDKTKLDVIQVYDWFSKRTKQPVTVDVLPRCPQLKDDNSSYESYAALDINI